MIKNINTTITEADIRKLIDRYMSGETTNEEEAKLRSWFRLAHGSDSLATTFLRNGVRCALCSALWMRNKTILRLSLMTILRLMLMTI